MQSLWWWSKTETCRSDIYVYFNVNFNVFFKIKKLHLLVSELYIYRNARCNNKKARYISIFPVTTNTHREKFYYVAASFDLELGPSSGHDKRIWIYTEIKYYNLEMPAFNFENTWKVYEKCTGVISNIRTSLFIYPTVAKLDYSKRMSKFTLKCYYMFRFNNHHQGATIRALL